MARRTPRIRFKPITASLMIAAPVMAKHLLPVFLKANNRIEKDYRNVGNRFKKNKPEWESKVDLVGSTPPTGGNRSMWSAVWTENDVMRWLNSGTSVRYRVMSPNWRSLTSPGGGIKVNHPKGTAKGWGHKPGIKPRNFSYDIAFRHQKLFREQAILAIIRASEEIFRIK